MTRKSEDTANVQGDATNAVLVTVEDDQDDGAVIAAVKAVVARLGLDPGRVLLAVGATTFGRPRFADMLFESFSPAPQRMQVVDGDVDRVPVEVDPLIERQLRPGGAIRLVVVLLRADKSWLWWCHHHLPDGPWEGSQVIPMHYGRDGTVTLTPPG